MKSRPTASLFGHLRNGRSASGLAYWDSLHNDSSAFGGVWHLVSLHNDRGDDRLHRDRRKTLPSVPGFQNILAEEQKNIGCDRVVLSAVSIPFLRCRKKKVQSRYKASIRSEDEKYISEKKKTRKPFPHSFRSKNRFPVKSLEQKKPLIYDF